MSQTTPDPGEEPDDRARLRRLLWVLPVLTFLAGLLLGGVLDLGDGGDGSPVDRGAGEVTASPVPSGQSTVAVPTVCAEGLERAERALDAADAGLVAVQDLDAAVLQRALDQLQRAQPEVARLASACRAAVDAGG